MSARKRRSWEIWDLMGLGSLAVLLMAYGLWWHSELPTPCVLCLIQQACHAMMVGAAWWRLRDTRAKFVMALAAIANGLTAFYHVGVEHHWWGSAVCDAAWSLNPAMWESSWQRSLGDCSRVSLLWQGWSLAEWNVAYALAWLGIGMIAALRRR